MDKPEQEKKPVMDRIWDEMTSVWPPLPKGGFRPNQPDPAPGLGGQVRSRSFPRRHPFEHHTPPADVKPTMDDWTVPHD